MEDKSVLEILEESGVLLDDRIEAKLLANPIIAARLGCELAAGFFKNSVQVVVGPGPVGAILAHCVAHHLCQLNGRAVWAVHVEPNLLNHTDFSFGAICKKLVHRQRVLVVVGQLTSDGPAKSVVKAVQDAGGIVVGLGAICKRGKVYTEDIGVNRIKSLHSAELI